VIDALVRHARDEAPNECCGLLVGHPTRVEEAVRARNLTPTPTRYLVDPADHFAALRRARARGASVIGAYHSHPASPAIPSPTDLAEALYTEFLYVIVSLADAGPPPVVRAYQLRGGSFQDVVLVPVL
jgi:proteasome lid subunit RPN8/RPN11